MKPKPLDTLQFRTPAFTACACAGEFNPTVPAAKPSTKIAIASFLGILSTSCLPNSAGSRARSHDGASYSLVPRLGAMVSFTCRFTRERLIDRTFRRRHGTGSLTDVGAPQTDLDFRGPELFAPQLCTGTRNRNPRSARRRVRLCCGRIVPATSVSLLSSHCHN